MSRVHQARDIRFSKVSLPRSLGSSLFRFLAKVRPAFLLFERFRSIQGGRIYRVSAFLLLLSALGCSMPFRSFGADLEYRRLLFGGPECVHCTTTDLSAFEPFGSGEKVEDAVAFRIANSDILEIALWHRTLHGTKAWCASALLTESGARRARDFAVDRSSDPLEDFLVLSIDGVVVDTVLRGTLRAGPSLGCFASGEEARRSLSPLGSIPIKEEL